MKVELIVGLVLLLVMIGSVAGYLVGTTNKGTVNPTQSSSVTGLELNVSINSTTLSPGQRLSITVSLYNSLPSRFNLTAANDWKVLGFPVALWPGCYYQEPVEFMIVKGHYSLGELQAASANTTISYSCHEGGQVGHLVFEPTSNEANLSGTFCVASCSPFHGARVTLVSNFSVNGYWAYPINSSEASDVYTPSSGCCVTYAYPEVGPIAQHLFIPGSYTVSVTDEWGQSEVEYFQVS